MSKSAVAIRYARALLEFAGSLPEAEKLAKELDLFAAAVKESKDLAEVLKNPAFLNERKAIVVAVATELKLGEPSLRTLKYLVDRDRIGALNEIVAAVRRMAEEKTGKVRAEVSTASELPEDRYQRIKAALERMTGRLVVLDKKVEPELIGGVVARVGSVVYDGSLRTQLRRFGASLGKES